MVYFDGFVDKLVTEGFFFDRVTHTADVFVDGFQKFFESDKKNWNGVIDKNDVVELLEFDKILFVHIGDLCFGKGPREFKEEEIAGLVFGLDSFDA